MFAEVLKDVVTQTTGGRAGLIMDLDGIALEQFVPPSSDTDVETAGMEFSVVIRSIQTAAQQIGGGDVEEIVVRTERLTIIIRLLVENYFAAVAVDPSGNIAKARFLLRTKKHEIVSALS